MSPAPCSAKRFEISMRDQRFVPSGLGRHAHGTCTSFSTAWRAAFIRRLEQRPNVHVKAEVRKCGRNDFRPAVVPVLAQLDDQHAAAGGRSDLPKNAYDVSLNFWRSPHRLRKPTHTHH